MIFESRPNVVIDCCALAIKSGNAIILKGGKEALYSNNILMNIARNAVKEILPIDSLQLIPSTDRETAQELLNCSVYVDLIIPRGGEKLIQYVKKNSSIPVIAHDRGLCHLYVDQNYDFQKARDVIINSKCQRPGVCNALETLLLHRSWAQEHLSNLVTELSKHNVEMRLCNQSYPILIEMDSKFKDNKNIRQASDEDWNEEYLDLILSIKLVENLEQAVEHIQKFGSYHTEAILSDHEDSINHFLSTIDASCLMINSSTRFNDGGQLGLGSEIGISTSKMHAYGPMGAGELVSKRFVVRGNAHLRI